MRKLVVNPPNHQSSHHALLRLIDRCVYVSTTLVNTRHWCFYFIILSWNDYDYGISYYVWLVPVPFFSFTESDVWDYRVNSSENNSNHSNPWIYYAGMSSYESIILLDGWLTLLCFPFMLLCLCIYSFARLPRRI